MTEKQGSISRMAVLAITILIGTGSILYAQDHSKDTTHAQQLAWWQAQRFGMFIHWGPVSQTGQEIGWSRGQGAAPVLPYDTLYKTFNPTGFNAGQWVKIAQDAGMKYMVFVSKHHDGFCEFNSALTNYKITSPQCPFGRDVTKELADSCHKAGLGLGLYYSPTDWYAGNNNSAAYLTYYTNQVVDELLSNYGRIETIWYDLGGLGADRTTLLNRMRQKQPWILVNDRGDTGPLADYRTPEQSIGSFDTTRRWESCMTIDGADQWAWNPDGGVKSLKQLLGMIVGCADGDGNCLLNIGPRPDGIIDPPMVTRLQQIGAWMNKYGGTIYGTRGGPIRGGSWGGTTHIKDTVFVHLTPFNGSVTIPTINAKIVSSTCLTGGTPAISQKVTGTTITLPARNVDSLYTVIKMVMDYSTQPFPGVITATQSSTAYDGDASRAIDGNTNGVYSNNSVSHTDSTTGAWWMVDLGNSYTIDTITIYNRTDGYMDRLGDFTVSVLDKNQAVVWSDHQTSYPNPVTTVDAGGKKGRYVKVQLTGAGYLSLAEVKVHFDTIPSVAVNRKVAIPEIPLYYTRGAPGYLLPTGSIVKLEFFDWNGRKLGTSVDGRQAAGAYRIGLPGRHNGLRAALYKLTIGDRVTVGKILEEKL